jgi:hypothetical protein
MFVVAPQPEEDDLWRLRRKPAGAVRMAAEGWQFLAENRPWDADEREAVARATGLYCMSPTGWMHEYDDWFKAFASAYSRTRNLNRALSECVGVGSGAEGRDG